MDDEQGFRFVTWQGHTVVNGRLRIRSQVCQILKPVNLKFVKF